MRFVQSQTDSKYCSYGLDCQGLSKYEALPYYILIIAMAVQSSQSLNTKWKQ